MSSRRNYRHSIDEAFHNGLDDYQEQPPDYIFDQIEDTLRSNKRKKRMALMRGIAAVVFIFIAFAAGYFFNYDISNLNNTHNIANQTTARESNHRYAQSEVRRPWIFLVPVIKSNNGSGLPQTNDTTYNTNTNTEFAKPDRNRELALNPVIIEDKKNNNYGEVTLDEPQVLATIDSKNYINNYAEEDEAELLAYNNKINNTQKKKSSVNVMLGSSVSKLYSVNVSHTNKPSGLKSSSLDKNSLKHPMSSVSGGMDISIASGERLSFYSGIYYMRKSGIMNHVNLEYSKASRTASNPRISSSYFSDLGIDMADKRINKMVMLSGKSGKYVSNSGGANTSTYYNLGLSLDQQYHYIEVPVGVNYSLIDKKFGLDAVVGMSTGVLLEQKAVLYDTESTYWEGHIEDVSKYIYNTQLGMNMSYRIFENFYLYCQPTYQRALNSIYKNKAGITAPNRFTFFVGINIDI